MRWTLYVIDSIAVQSAAVMRMKMFDVHLVRRLLQAMRRVVARILGLWSGLYDFCLFFIEDRSFQLCRMDSIRVREDGRYMYSARKPRAGHFIPPHRQGITKSRVGRLSRSPKSRSEAGLRPQSALREWCNMSLVFLAFEMFSNEIKY